MVVGDSWPAAEFWMLRTPRALDDGRGRGGQTRTWSSFLSRGGNERRFEPTLLLGPGRVGLVLVDDDSRPAMELFEGVPASAAEMAAKDRGGCSRGWHLP